MKFDMPYSYIRELYLRYITFYYFTQRKTALRDALTVEKYPAWFIDCANKKESISPRFIIDHPNNRVFIMIIQVQVILAMNNGSIDGPVSAYNYTTTRGYFSSVDGANLRNVSIGYIHPACNLIFNE